jgi:hypothetical protein
MILRVLLESDLTQEIAVRMSDTNKEEGERGTNRGVDTILNGQENGDKYRSRPDQEFEGRNMTEGVDLGGLGNQIQNGVNYYRGYASSRNPGKGGVRLYNATITEEYVCQIWT